MSFSRILWSGATLAFLCASLLVVRMNRAALFAHGSAGKAAAALAVCPPRAANASVPAKSGAQGAAKDPRLAGAYRFERGEWTYVHLHGSPGQIGFQHGYLLAPEIEDALKTVQLVDTHGTHRPWSFFQQAARTQLWPHLDAEYQQEIRGILEGVQARGVKMTLDDVVALNGFEELPDYYVPWYNSQHKVAMAPHLTSPGNCSAFVATGSYTSDHKIVIAHNNWTNYMDGERWRIMFDIQPSRGYRILMDGYPGVITSDDDFGINSSGLMITETTISQFYGWNPNGKPEFMRSRKALQYGSSIDDYVSIMLDGNNGGYANDWLIGDRKTGEIAQFELGLKAYKVWRTKDGYFVGSNFARDPKVIAEDTQFNPKDPASSPNARRTRWEQLMRQNKGRIDVAMAEEFMADHEDAYAHTAGPDERSLCGHGDASPRGVSVWDWPPYYPGGAVQGKATDSSMTALMELVARAGHPCGQDFIASSFLKAHPEYSWMSPQLRDMKAGPWTVFKANDH
jgi:hypothetical protein